jgi:hypothetical protein
MASDKKTFDAVMGTRGTISFRNTPSPAHARLEPMKNYAIIVLLV